MGHAGGPLAGAGAPLPALFDVFGNDEVFGNDGVFGNDDVLGGRPVLGLLDVGVGSDGPNSCSGV